MSPDTQNAVTLLPIALCCAVCDRVYRGAFKGEVLLVFESKNDDNESAFADARTWHDEINHGGESHDSHLGPHARATFVTRDQLDRWRGEVERSKQPGGSKSAHWARRLFQHYPEGSVSFVKYADEMDRQKKRREGALLRPLKPLLPAACAAPKQTFLCAVLYR